METQHSEIGGGLEIGSEESLPGIAPGDAAELVRFAGLKQSSHRQEL
ncbi:MAG: hypothetical protein RL141_897, partial [Candidatus Parcubacteria bacterium]